MEISDNQQTMRDMMMTSYGDEKYDKKKELNSEMSIAPSEPDEYGKKIMSIGGSD